MIIFHILLISASRSNRQPRSHIKRICSSNKAHELSKSYLKDRSNNSCFFSVIINDLSEELTIKIDYSSVKSNDIIHEIINFLLRNNSINISIKLKNSYESLISKKPSISILKRDNDYLIELIFISNNFKESKTYNFDKAVIESSVKGSSVFLNCHSKEFEKFKELIPDGSTISINYSNRNLSDLSIICRKKINDNEKFIFKQDFNLFFDVDLIINLKSTFKSIKKVRMGRKPYKSMYLAGKF